jgi:hypothetical protein
MNKEEAVRWALRRIELIIIDAERFGHRDAVLVAMDEAFAALRKKNRDDLTAKHQPAVPPPQTNPFTGDGEG